MTRAAFPLLFPMPLHTMDDVAAFLRAREESRVEIRPISLEQCSPWHYDAARGEIRRPDGAFFRVAGFETTTPAGKSLSPILLQEEIGYLGILCKTIAGERHYLLQAKIEPGNRRAVQLSPTIQATKSNFTRAHGGKEPPFLDYFRRPAAHGARVLSDTLGSEQNSRYLAKRNRNLVVELPPDDDTPLPPSHIPLTLPQIKALCRVPNLINADTRTVLSTLPVWEEEYTAQMRDPALRASATVSPEEEIAQVLSYFNDYKMYDETTRRVVPLKTLPDWEMRGDALVCRRPAPFRIVFREIAIEGREVACWRQPLLEPLAEGTHALATRVKNGRREFLVRATPERGCLDKLELGPTLLCEPSPGQVRPPENDVERVISQKTAGGGFWFDTLLSEEGGRFLHEQNRALILDADGALDDERELPPGYFWLGLRALATLARLPHTVNIQLRSLLAVLPWEEAPHD